jgi:hypothetical protein
LEESKDTSSSGKEKQRDKENLDLMILVSWFINLFRSKERIRRGREKRVQIITGRKKKKFTFHPRLASSDRRIGSSTGQSPGHVSMHSVKKKRET